MSQPENPPPPPRKKRKWLDAVKKVLPAAVILAAAAFLLWPSSQDVPPVEYQVTLAVQRVVLDALRAYHQARGNYPDGDMVAVMKELSVEPASSKILAKLGKDFWGGPGTPLRDAYKRDMKYQPTGALDGGPLVISAGKDGAFDTGDDMRSDRR